MSLKLKCHWYGYWYDKKYMLLKLKCHIVWDVSKTEMSLKLKFRKKNTQKPIDHSNLNVTQTKMSQALTCD